jgi:hypothetical protein
MLMPNLPGKATTQRVRVWRRLQSAGAVAVRPSVYVLPAREECVEAFQWIARELAEIGGQASMCEGQFCDGVSDEEVERKLLEARSSDYAALGADARELAKALRKKRIAPEQLATLEGQLARLKQRFESIAAIDYLEAPGKEGAQELLASIGRTLASHGAGKSDPERLPRAPRPRGATWVTRVGVHVDRIACAWLIRRHIDPQAKLKFVPPRGYLPAPGELRFDMYEAEFTHVGDRCSFEVLLERMGIDDPALAALGELVHDIDLRDHKFGRIETAGLASAVTGICATHRDDIARIDAAAPILEALTAYFGLRPRGSKTGGRSV